MSESYAVNVSSVQDFVYCPFRWVCKWLENRVPRNEPRAFGFGKLYHKLFEWHQGEGLSKEAALTAAREEWIARARDEDPNGTAWADAVEDLESMREPFLLWQDQYPFEVPVVEVEQPYLLPFPGDPSIVIKMRPDRVGVRVGKLWHVQHKALAASKGFQNFVLLAKRSYHEHIYAEGIAQKYPDIPYGGTHFDLYRKLKYRKKQTLKQIQSGTPGDVLNGVDKLFWQHPMPVDLDSPLHKHVLDCLREKIQQMRWTESMYRTYNVVPAPNEDRNGGYYGGTPDEYFRVLIGEIQLDDDRYFKERTDTYATPETD
jgi:hypothetical protein